MTDILAHHSTSRCYATLKNALCFLRLFISKINDQRRSHLVVIQNGFEILLEQRHLAGVFLFMLSIFN